MYLRKRDIKRALKAGVRRMLMYVPILKPRLMKL